jgi:hypothetical protein
MNACFCKRFVLSTDILFQLQQLRFEFGAPRHGGTPIGTLDARKRTVAPSVEFIKHNVFSLTSEKQCITAQFHDFGYETKFY